MSNIAVIQSRYTCDVATIATKKSKSNAAKGRCPARAITVKPSSDVTKHLSRLLHSIDSADEAYNILTACMEEKKSLLHLPSGFGVDESDNISNINFYHPSQHQQQEGGHTVREIFDHELNHVEKLRQKIINRKCTGWKYPDTQNCINAMANIVEIAVNAYIQQQRKQQRQSRQNVFQCNDTPTSVFTTKSSSISATCSTSHRTTPCRNVPTEILLSTEATKSVDDYDDVTYKKYFPSIDLPPSSTNHISECVSVLAAPTTNTVSPSPLIQNIVESDSDDSIKHSATNMLAPRSVSIVPTARFTPQTSLTPSPFTRFVNHPSVLEHAIVSDDSEMDVARTATISKHEVRTTSSTTIASKKICLVHALPENDPRRVTIPIHVRVPAQSTMTEDEVKLQNFWTQFLEHVHFLVTISSVSTQHHEHKRKLCDRNSSRSSSNVPKALSIYEVYRLYEPIYLQAATPANDIHDKIYAEFTSLFYGMTNCAHRRSRQQRLNDDDKNVRITVLPVNNTYIWIQLNINTSYDFAWEGIDSQNQSASCRNFIKGLKKNKNHIQFMVLIPSCNVDPQNIIAISAGQMKSKSKYVSYILSAIESAFANPKPTSDEILDDANPESEANDNIVTRDKFTATYRQAKKPQYEQCSSGVDPYELFRTLQLRVSSKNENGPLKSCLASAIDTRPHGSTLTGLYSAATGCLYNDNTHNEHIVRSRKRRSRNNNDDNKTKQNEIDVQNQNPIRTIVRWDWNGLTNTSVSGWEPRIQNIHGAHAISSRVAEFPFKCRMTMSGSNVVSGIQALMDHRYIKKSVTSSSIPHYIQAVTTESQTNLLFGDKNKEATIRIENGDIVMRQN